MRPSLLTTITALDDRQHREDLDQEEAAQRQLRCLLACATLGTPDVVFDTESADADLHTPRCPRIAPAVEGLAVGVLVLIADTIGDLIRRTVRDC